MIIYRRNTHDLAGWMPENTQRIKSGDYYLMATGEPWLIIGQANQAKRWKKLADCEMISQPGDMPEPRYSEDSDGIMRVTLPDGSRVVAYPITASTGKVWYVPQLVTIIGEQSKTTLSLAWGRSESGALMRVMTAEQKRICETAAAIFAELTTKLWDQIDMHVAVEWATEILAMTYHAAPDCFLEIGALDDHLILRILTASIGLGTPEDD